jgi:hypothetical protein
MVKLVSDKQMSNKSKPVKTENEDMDEHLENYKTDL